MKQQVRIDGLDNLDRDFRRVAKAFDSKHVERAAINSAEIIRKQAERNAPRGPTGNLKDAIITKPLKRTDTLASAVAGVDRKKAPHAYWVEYGGNKVRRPKNATVMYDQRTGKVYGTEVARMPAQPYFRPAVMSRGKAAADNFWKELERLVNGAVR